MYNNVDFDQYSCTTWNAWACLVFWRTLRRTNCSWKVCEIESGSWQSWLWWQMIICKRPDPPDDHLQEASPSGWWFARGRPLWMIICKRPAPPDQQQLQPQWRKEGHQGDRGNQGWRERKRRRRKRRKRGKRRRRRKRNSCTRTGRHTGQP